MKNQRTNLSLELHQRFEHGGKTYSVEHPKETKSCHGCAFCEKDGNRCTLDNTSSDVPNCFGLNRHDGMDVIFVELTPKDTCNPIEEYARSLAAEHYREYIKQDCFVEGFLAAYETDFSFLTI